VNTSPDVIEEGLRAWAAGNLDALEAVLDPQVNLRWVEPGPWDCTDRDQVMRLLRQRQTERHGQPPYRVQVTRVDGDTYVVSSASPIDPDGPQPFRVATRITVANGKVTEMQQYKTKAKRADQA
jgi:ketosteroid isomerase-like protein